MRSAVLTLSFRLGTAPHIRKPFLPTCKWVFCAPTVWRTPSIRYRPGCRSAFRNWCRHRRRRWVQESPFWWGNSTAGAASGRPAPAFGNRDDREPAGGGRRAPSGNSRGCPENCADLATMEGCTGKSSTLLRIYTNNNGFYSLYIMYILIYTLRLSH